MPHDFNRMVNAPSTPELNAFSSLANAFEQELHNRNSEVMRRNPLYVWSATHARWMTLEDMEDLTNLPVGEVTPERFQDLPQNLAPVEIVQDDLGTLYTAVPKGELDG